MALSKLAEIHSFGPSNGELAVMRAVEACRSSRDIVTGADPLAIVLQYQRGGNSSSEARKQTTHRGGVVFKLCRIRTPASALLEVKSSRCRTKFYIASVHCIILLISLQSDHNSALCCSEMESMGRVVESTKSPRALALVDWLSGLLSAFVVKGTATSNPTLQIATQVLELTAIEITRRSSWKSLLQKNLIKSSNQQVGGNPVVDHRITFTASRHKYLSKCNHED